MVRRLAALLGIVLACGAGNLAAQGADPFAAGQLQVQGSRLTIEAADTEQTVDVGEPVRVRTCYGGVCGALTPGDPRVSGLRVLGELRGPELPAPITYEAVPGGAFALPGFQTEGEYVLESIRLVDGAGRVLGAADPPEATLHVRQILLASASVRALSLDDLRARGIALTEDSFQAYHTVDLWTKRSGIQLKHTYDGANRLLTRHVQQPGRPGAPATDGGDSYSWDPMSRLLSAARPSSPAQGVVYQGYDAAGRPAREIVGTRDPLTRQWDTWSREASVTLPSGIGRHPSGPFTGYQRTFDALDRVVSLDASVQTLGATFAWGGSARLYSQVTRGALHTTHRSSFLGSPFGPQPPGTVTTPWRLGMVSVGASGTATPDTAAPSHLWGQLGFGYRQGPGAKLGRKVMTTPSLLSGEGWSWDLDNALRLSTATPGTGSLQGPAPSDAPDRFETTYGPGDEIRAVTRDSSGETTTHAFGPEGRITARDRVAFGYDEEGHRTSDDRFLYTWGFRDELLAVTVKPCWPKTPTDATSQPSAACPDQVRPLYANHQVRILRDAVGRVFAEEHYGPQSTPGSDASRPFVEKKELLWDGDSLVSEAGRAADGTLLWRKSYVPGPSGVDDAVQLRVEKYDVAGTLVSDKLYAYVRDEQGTVLALVDEASPDPAKPTVLLRNLYDPYGEAHAETGPEVRVARLEPDQLSLPGGSPSQNVNPATAAAGRLRLSFSLAADPTTLTSGVVVERRLTDGTWGALNASELALARDPAKPEDVLLLPLSGWQRGTTYRIRLTAGFKDVFGRAPSAPPALEMPVPSDGSALTWQKTFPIAYDTYLTAGETSNGTLPGGQTLLWQGAWTSSVTGLQYKRARVYDPRTSAFLSEDPLGDVDSPNLYGYVAGRPHEATDPWGLLGLEDVPGILADYMGSNVKSAAGMAVGLADQATGGRITGARRAYEAARAKDGTPKQRLAAAYGAYEQGKLAVTTLGFSEAPDMAAHAAELVGLRGISRGASTLGEGIETGDVDTMLRGGAEAAGGVGQFAGSVAAAAAPFEKALASQTVKFDSAAVSAGPLPLGGAKVIRAPPARAYSAAYETSIPKRGIGTRESHFKAANENLAAEMASNPQLAAHMDTLGVGIPKSASGTVLGESPANWTWHHVKDRPGVLQLVPRPQHRGGPWQGLLHPQQEGGFKIWGSQY